MRRLSANVAPLIQSKQLETIYLVRVTDYLGNVIFTTTTFYADVELDNGFIYESNGKLLSADPPQLSTTVDREQYSISLADPEFVLAIEAETGMVGRRLEVRVGFIDPSTGLPFTSPADTFVIYRGSVEGASYKINTEQYGESVLQITGTSPILSLEMRKGILLSRDAVRQRNASDTSCDAIYEGSSMSLMKWGKN